MSTAVTVNTYTHTVTHVTAKMLYSIQRIIQQIGLDPAKFLADWDALERGISTWLESQHLREVTLEVWDPSTDALMTRWDISVNYGYSGDGSLWADIDGIKYAIKKAGTVPILCSYRIVVDKKPGAAAVSGWTGATLRSTDHLKRYGVGSTIGGNGIAAETSYWR
jgi:hypothetical protein